MNSALALTAFILLLTIALLVPACINLAWMLHAWRSPETNAAIPGARPATEATTSFSAIVPFRHEV